MGEWEGRAVLWPCLMLLPPALCRGLVSGLVPPSWSGWITGRLISQGREEERLAGLGRNSSISPSYVPG